jgi:pyrroline-5-carboxylate reductase
MNDISIAFIGGGNMAGSLIGGLIADGYPRELLRVSDADTEKLRQLSERFGIRACAANTEAVAGAAVVVLAVKPQVVEPVARELAPALNGEQLVISIAAGIRTSTLSAWLGNVPIVRAMPNTPALVQSGATALYAPATVRTGHRESAESIMRAVGLTQWIDDENLMDVVTALSGSGPAYFFLFMELLEEEACRLGLAPQIARLLTVQTAFGAAKMALESPLYSPAGAPRGRSGRAAGPGATGCPRPRHRIVQSFRQRIRMTGNPYLSNAAAYLLDTVFSIYILLIMLRFLLQWVRADFYNPVCQFLVKATNPPLRPLRRVIPGMWGIDLASIVLMVALQMLAFWLIQMTAGRTMAIPGLLLFSISELIALALNVFLISILIQVILSWVNPNAYNPLVSLLYSLNEPLMRPVRRMLPNTGGIDFSPLAVLLLIQLTKMLVVAPLRDLALGLA